MAITDLPDRLTFVISEASSTRSVRSRDAVDFIPWISHETSVGRADQGPGLSADWAKSRHPTTLTSRPPGPPGQWAEGCGATKGTAYTAIACRSRDFSSSCSSHIRRCRARRCFGDTCKRLVAACGSRPAMSARARVRAASPPGSHEWLSGTIDGVDRVRVDDDSGERIGEVPSIRTRDIACGTRQAGLRVPTDKRQTASVACHEVLRGSRRRGG